MYSVCISSSVRALRWGLSGVGLVVVDMAASSPFRVTIWMRMALRWFRVVVGDLGGLVMVVVGLGVLGNEVDMAELVEGQSRAGRVVC